MRLVHTKTPLPRWWLGMPVAAGIILESDLPIGRSRLRAKLLVFKSSRDLHAFWKGPLGKGHLGRYCRGAVNGLGIEVQEYHPGKLVRTYIEADPRYFCIIGLVRGYLTMEVICHEAVHAGFAYAKRIRRSPWDEQARHFDEEAVCYPVGRIAGTINKVLHDNGVYPT